MNTQVLLDIKFILPILASFGALIFSYLNYKRSFISPNETLLYKSKVEVYTKIMTELVSFTSLLQKKLTVTENYLKNTSIKDKEYLEKIATDVDDICFKLDDFIIANSVIIPNTVLTKLKNLLQKILFGDGRYITQNPIDKLAPISKLLDEVYNDCNTLLDLFREDLHIEKLNNSLFKSLQKV